MSFYRDRQIKAYCWFLVFWGLLILVAEILFTVNQVNAAKAMYLSHDGAVVSSLIEHGVSKTVIAAALTNTETSEAGQALLTAVGVRSQTENRVLPFVHQFQQNTFYSLMAAAIFLMLVLAVGTFIFVWQRKRLYQQAGDVLTSYINGDYSCHLPQNSEGAIYQLFAFVDQLATMLQSKSEAEHNAKVFLKGTISDISHQLKTPLAALVMYQEIIEDEPDNVETVKEFSAKIGISLKRMEQLIQAMLKITCLDTGNIVFEKRCCKMTDLIALSLNELTTRAENEHKNILIDGDPEQQLICDLEWTSEAIANIIKNALDHMAADGLVHITWECTPAMLRIIIADDGSGIAPEDIHHIFKRFYRSTQSLDTQGIGLGLPLAKSIIEGQKGVLSVRSTLGVGTVFMISFLTES